MMRGIELRKKEGWQGKGKGKETKQRGRERMGYRCPFVKTMDT